MRVEPLGDKVVIKLVEPEETTTGGIHLPNAAQPRSFEGRVLSVGDGRVLADGTRIPQQLSEGDRVLVDQYAGTEVVVDEESLLIMREDDVLAVLE